MQKQQSSFWKMARTSGLYIREIIGWALMAGGLHLFYVSLQLIRPSEGYVPLIIEGLIAAFMGFIVFRGGLQLVKVSVAARTVRGDRNSEDKHTDYTPTNSPLATRN